jgi:hypothetical protein
MSAVADSSVDYEMPAADDLPATEFPYRSISRTAILALVLGLLSSLALAFVSLTVLAIVGLVLGISSWRNIRRFPEELTGSGLAMTGAVLSGLFLVGAVAWHTYDYLTEVPEGYQRVAFYELQPNPENRGEIIPKQAIELSGEKVFIKGYVHPGVASMGKVKHFVLVPDMGTCCFGGQPKRNTDMIEVVIEDGEGIRYSTRQRKLSGTFLVGQPRNSVGGLHSVMYAMEADKAK